jgi:hypothetical protein
MSYNPIYVPCISHISPYIHGHFRNLNWRYLPFLRLIFKAYVKEYPHKILSYMVQYLHFQRFPHVSPTFFSSKSGLGPCCGHLPASTHAAGRLASSFPEPGNSPLIHIVHANLMVFECDFIVIY